MKCRNFLCGNFFPESDSKTNCAGIHWWGHISARNSFVIGCEARLRYNRILDTREVKYQINELTFYCVDIDQERNIYYGRTK